MKNRIITFSLAACVASTISISFVFAQKKTTNKIQAATTTSACKPLPATSVNQTSEVVKRGQLLGESPSVSLADVLKEPQKFTGKSVKVEGVIERNCTNKGCWMELAPKAGADESVRVTFKDYGFFVPLNSRGMKAKAEGEFSLKVLSKEKADHYAGEGARLKRNPDGTSNEISFVATGVELYK